jgi:hypothetical protein
MEPVDSAGAYGLAGQYDLKRNGFRGGAGFTRSRPTTTTTTTTTTTRKTPRLFEPSKRFLVSPREIRGLGEIVQ